jgi:hypothetical protein
MFINIAHLKQVRTISAVKALVSFLTKSETLGSKIIDYSRFDLSEDSGISLTSAKLSIAELIEIGFIEKIERKGSKATTYRILIDNDQSNKDEVETDRLETDRLETDRLEVSPPIVENTYKKACAASNKEEQESNNIIKINNIDFNNININIEDINSLSVLNTNLFMTDKELGKLANRVFKEVFLPNLMVKNNSVSWHCAQRGFMKDLLVQYRTEQVVAGIIYWTEIKQAPKGITSLKFLMWKNRKGKTNLMEGLDYFKQEYIKNSHEHLGEEAEKIIVDQMRKKRDEEEEMLKQKERVENMSNEDFIEQMFSGT